MHGVTLVGVLQHTHQTHPSSCFLSSHCHRCFLLRVGGIMGKSVHFLRTRSRLDSAHKLVGTPGHICIDQRVGSSAERQNGGNSNRQQDSHCLHPTRGGSPLSSPHGAHQQTFVSCRQVGNHPSHLLYSLNGEHPGRCSVTG